jgi:CheY-like chemotaxis protein/anti-sigma regulatory factor (Ser/Thr protein kinase)
MSGVSVPSAGMGVPPAAYQCAAGQPVALVVDDSPVDRFLAGSILESRLGMRVVYAANGAEALRFLARDEPAVVITDLQMPDVDGLALVDAVRERHALVPVVLITAYGSEEVALEALRRGAASYVPKRDLDRVLVGTVERVLAAVRVDRRRQRLLDCMLWTDSQFVLDNDPSMIPTLVAHYQEHLLRLGLCDQTGKTRVGIALEEALVNALYHGNLEISSQLRQPDDSAFYRLATERSRVAPYRDRRIHVQATLSRAEAKFVVRDEGPGFDPAALPDPTDPANLENLHGRGVLLIRTFMDEVRYNATGNEITMIKRREGSAEAPCGS